MSKAFQFNNLDLINHNKGIHMCAHRNKVKQLSLHEYSIMKFVIIIDVVVVIARFCPTSHDKCVN